MKAVFLFVAVFQVLPTSCMEEKPKSLHEALSRYQEKDFGNIQKLLDSGADVNEKWKGGGGFMAETTPLHVVCDYGRPGSEALVALLLSRHADPNAEDVQGDTPLHCICFSACNSCFISGDDTRERNVMLKLLARADKNKKNIHGETPLSQAIGSFHVLQLLLEQGADPNEGTLLHYAVKKEKQQNAMVLFQHGADLTKKDGGGNTPLHVAFADSSFLAGSNKKRFVIGLELLKAAVAKKAEGAVTAEDRLRLAEKLLSIKNKKGNRVEISGKVLGKVLSGQLSCSEAASLLSGEESVEELLEKNEQIFSQLGWGKLTAPL